MYRKIDPAFRSQRHLRIARYLETTYRKDESGLPRQIAMHFEAAGDARAAAAWYLSAARAATRSTRTPTQSNWPAARSRFPRPMKSERQRWTSAKGARTTRRPQRTTRGHRRVGRPFGGKFPRALRRHRTPRDAGSQFGGFRRRRPLRRGVEGRRRGDRHGEAAQALIYASTHAKLCGRSAEALDIARRALESYEDLGDVQGQFEALFRLVEITSHIGEAQASRSDIEAMRERSTSLANRAVEARALAMVATALMLRQEYRAAFDLSQRSLEISLATNNPKAKPTAAAVWPQRPPV